MSEQAIGRVKPQKWPELFSWNLSIVLHVSYNKGTKLASLLLESATQSVKLWRTHVFTYQQRLEVKGDKTAVDGIEGLFA